MIDAEGNREPILVIDMGGTSIKIGLVVEGRPQPFRAVHSAQTLRDGDPIEALAIMIGLAVAESGIAPRFIVATVPGFINTDGDHVLFAANIPGLNGRALASELGAATGCEVFLERDSVLLLSGEATAGAAQQGGHVLGLFFGTGIGVAYLENGVPFRGGGWALELGLMPFRGDGRVLPGLPKDCLEAYCSGRVLQEIASRHDVEVSSVFRVAERRPALSEELQTFVRYQAMAVGCAVAMVSPQTIVLGGGILDMEGFPRDQLSRLIEEYGPVAETGRAMDLRWTRLGWASVLHGAPHVVAQRATLNHDAVNPAPRRSMV